VRHRTTSLLAATLMLAGFGTAQVCDLKPPAGAKVAIIEYYDLECPSCAAANPTLVDAQKQYKIPLVRMNFPIPIHHWSRQAMINAAWFDTKSPELGEEYRNEVFAHQPEITPGNLREFTDNFAKAHHVQLPFAMDPRGELEGRLQHDYNYGVAHGVQHTPTICVVASGATSGPSYVEVTDVGQLFSTIDAMKRATASTTPPSTSKKTTTAKKKKSTTTKQP
jgi:protein-disulfide isomerase